jgi:hypothetical protein
MRVSSLFGVIPANLVEQSPVCDVELGVGTVFSLSADSYLESIEADSDRSAVHLQLCPYQASPTPK